MLLSLVILMLLLKPLFESELIAMCENTGLVISDYEIFGRASNTYTYVSDM